MDFGFVVNLFGCFNELVYCLFMLGLLFTCCLFWVVLGLLLIVMSFGCLVCRLIIYVILLLWVVFDLLLLCWLLLYTFDLLALRCFVVCWMLCRCFGWFECCLCLLMVVMFNLGNSVVVYRLFYIWLVFGYLFRWFFCSFWLCCVFECLLTLFWFLRGDFRCVC